MGFIPGIRDSSRRLGFFIPGIWDFLKSGDFYPGGSEIFQNPRIFISSHWRFFKIWGFLKSCDFRKSGDFQIWGWEIFWDEDFFDEDLCK